MVIISSHPKLPEFKMRVLIVSAFLAYAAAAPSGLITPYIYQPVVIPAAVPTISPGDIQAAAINAQVQVNDLARAAADKAQELADQAVENANEKVVTDVDQINEKNVEAFWSREDKKWQAIDALKTAEAQVDGAAASNADIYAKTAVGGVVPFVAAVGPVAAVAPVVGAPIPPVVYNPYLSAVKTVSTQTVEIKAEEKKEENQEVTVDAAVKNAEPEKVEAPVEKVEEKPAEKALDLNKPAVFTGSIIQPVPSLYQYNVVSAVGPVVAQPLVKFASFPAVHGALAPTFVQRVW